MASASEHIDRPILNLINPDVEKRAAVLREQFRSAQPFPHLVIDDFLDSEYCRELIAEFPVFDEKLALNEYNKVGRKAVFQNLPEIGPSYAKFDRLIHSREFLSVISDITGIPGLLYDPDYIGGGTHENLSGQGLDVHVDFNYHPKTRLHRRLNLLLFLNPEWKEEWEGVLELHVNPWLPPEQDRITRILPVANRCVVFETSEHSWHGFQNIRIPEGKKTSRKSIAVYFYTKERPESEVAPDHATIYVHPPLPAHIRPGYTLGEGDFTAIRSLLERRDQHMKFLYEREKKFSATLAGIVNSRTFRLARLLAWPIHKLRSAIKP